MYAITAVKNPFRDTKPSVFYVNNFIINARRVSSFLSLQLKGHLTGDSSSF